MWGDVPGNTSLSAWSITKWRESRFLHFIGNIELELSIALQIGGSAENPQHQSKPHASLSSIKHIYSHPQAFGQCNTYLSNDQYLKAAERHEVSSTSKAAEVAAQDPSGQSAAISSRLAADLYNLDILDERIEDQDDNATRFFVIQKVPASSLPRSTSSTLDSTSLYSAPTNENPTPQSQKSLIAFSVPHTLPGALAAALNVFKTHGLNLTSINSRPSREMPWHYIFLIEIDEGLKSQQGQGGKEVGAVADALRELTELTRETRYLGSWEDQAKKG